MNNLFRKNKKGFTLIELIVVIAILAILAAVAVPTFIGYADKANKEVARANATTIATAINTFNALNPGAEVAATDIATIAALETKLDSGDVKLSVKGITEEQFSAAMDYITYDSNIATVNQT